MIRKLIALSTVLGAAAVLSNKDRRDRLFSAAKELMKNASAKADQLQSKAEEKFDDMKSDVSSAASTAGASTRSAYTRPGSF